MPTVPVIDQTAQGASPYAAPGVAPMRNDAPSQLADAGQVLQQTGAMARHIGDNILDRVQTQVDDAKTKAAETNFLSTAQGILYDPQSGYFRQQGKSAVDQYQPAKEAVVKAGKDALDGLDNGIQKQMFQQVMQQHLLSFGQKMADYNHSQSVAWSAGESKARADSLSLLALGSMDSRYQRDEQGAPVGDFSKYVAQMDAEVLNSAKLAGFDPDSAQAKAMLREQHTALNHSMISTMLDNHDAAGAKKWLEQEKAAGNFDMRSLTPIENAVKSEYDRQHVNDVAQEVISASLSGGKVPTTLAMPVAGSSINVTAGLGEARANGRSHDGIDIAVPVGTSVMAPASGKVTKVWTDDKFGGGLSVEIQMPNGYTAGFAHLSAANVHVGDELQQGTQLGLSGKTGNATGPVLHYMMKDADGKYVDPRQVSQPQPNKDGFADPNALDAALKAVDRRSDLDSAQKRQVQEIVEAEHAHARTIQTQQQTDIYKQVSDAFYRGGMNVNAVPPSLFAQITPEQQQKLKDEQTNKVLSDYSHSQAFKEMGEVDLRSYFSQNPDMLTPANVDAARPRLSNSSYLSLMGQASHLANSPEKVQEAQGIDDQIKYYAGHAGINIAPKTAADKQTLTDLHARIDQSLNRARAQNNGKVTQDQAEKIIKQEIIQRTVTTPRKPWDPRAFFYPNVTKKLPLGATQTMRGSDGKDHYVDRNGQDLGVVN